MPLATPLSSSKKNLKLLCLSGWACTRKLDSWYGYEAKTLIHTEQFPLYKLQASLAEDIFPSEPWAMVSWSMGNWGALSLAAQWKKNPPRFWLALSPFWKMVGPDFAVSKEAYQTLTRFYAQNPKECLAFFQKKNGAGDEAWSEELFRDEDLALFGQTLDALGGSPPMSPFHLDVPLFAVYGHKDRLVNAHTLSVFCQSLGLENSENQICLKNAGHGLFYEHRPELKELLESLIEDYAS